MYIKARSIAFPAYLSPHQDIQFCDVMLALQNYSEMRIVKSLCDTFRYDCKLSAECPWLKAITKIMMMIWMVYTWRCHLCILSVMCKEIHVFF